MQQGGGGGLFFAWAKTYVKFPCVCTRVCVRAMRVLLRKQDPGCENLQGEEEGFALAREEKKSNIAYLTSVHVIYRIALHSTYVHMFTTNRRYGIMDRHRMSPKGRFVAESLVLWALLCLPINVLTLFLRSVAPPYDHHGDSGGSNGTTDGIIETNIDDTERLVIFKSEL